MPTHGRRWTFNTTVEDRHGQKKTITLMWLADIPIERHIKVKGTASPDDPHLHTYWADRQTYVCYNKIGSSANFVKSFN